MDVRPFGSNLCQLLMTTFVALALLTSSIGCSQKAPGSSSPADQSGDQSGGHSEASRVLSAKEAAASFTITDSDGAPVPSAKIMIGPRENVPFPGNVFRTNDKGVLLIPSEWTDAQPVTIEARGFVRATYFGSLPSSSNFVLRKAVVFQKVELKGATSGFGQLKTDGYLDLGLVFPAIQRSEVSTLNIAHLISPEVDHMTVLGQDLTIPSNITFPDQSENYIFPIRFNKPQYRWYSAETGAFKFIALHGRVPFKSTVDDLRSGKSFFDIINTIEFRQGSMTNVSLTTPTQTLALAVNTMPLAKTVSFTSPNYEAGNIVLAAAISERDGVFFPTDLKNVTSGSNVRLASPQDPSASLILASLRAKNTPTTGPASEFTSSVVLPANSSQAFEFLPQIAAPTLENEILKLDQPRAPATVTPVLTFAALNKIETIRNGDIKVERKSPQWDVYSSEWTDSLQLPVFPSTEPGTTERMRWEVAFGAVGSGQTLPVLGPQSVERLTHITRSALDL